MKNDYWIVGKEVYIKLIRSKFPPCWTIIDLIDFNKINSFDYTISAVGDIRKTYAYFGGSNGIPLHRIICNLSRENILEPDHINNNGLDNRRENLQIVTNLQNRRLAKIRSNAGVYWIEEEKNWCVQFNAEGITYLKRVATKKEATKMRDLLHLVCTLKELSSLQIGEKDDFFASQFNKASLINQTYEKISKQTTDFRDRIYYRPDKNRYIVNPHIKVGKRIYKSFILKIDAIKYAEDLMDIHIPNWRFLLC